MILYLEAKTNIPDVYIDYIEATLQNGKTVSLNWDQSNICRNEDGFDARYKGVYFDEEYANGRIRDLEGLHITDIGLYYESSGTFHFEIQELEFEDNGQTLVIPNPEIPKDCRAIKELSADSLSAKVKSAAIEAENHSACSRNYQDSDLMR